MQLNRWMDNLEFYILFNSNSVSYNSRKIIAELLTEQYERLDNLVETHFQKSKTMLDFMSLSET